MATTKRATSSYDFCDPEFYRDPWDAYRWLRENAPVSWDAKNSLWAITTHADVSYISRHPEQFCSGQGIRPYTSFDLSLLALDGDVHFRQRQIVSRGFTPKVVTQLESTVRAKTDRLLDGFVGRSELDFIDDLAAPLPLEVIADLMGFPDEGREQLRVWSDLMVAGEGHVAEDDPALIAAATAAMEYVGHVSGLIEQRRTDGFRGDDLISVLARAEEEGLFDRSGETLDESELLFFLVLLIVAGNETTRNAMSGGFAAFHRNPGEWQRFVAAANAGDTAFTAKAADEILRYVTPVLSFCRTATETAEVNGQRIESGEKVLLLYQSANRDPSVFDAPDEFRIDRSPNPHLAFGIGPHFCLGANLARLEIRVVFEQLAKRFPNATLPDAFVPAYQCVNTLVHAIDRLPMTV
ncbi:MAG: cytochrome P450 [Acidimicrobiia bacterium]